MMAVSRGWRVALFASAAVGLAACGGGHSNNSNNAGGPPPSGPNVVPLVVDSGPNGNSLNQAYVTIKICAPGSTSNCQTIDHVWVDTGSSGIRLIGTVVTASLPLFMDPNNSSNAVANCVQFVQAYSWGAMRTADVTIGNKTAANVPIQVIGDTGGGLVPAPGNTTAPSTCVTGTSYNTVGQIGANGLLGVGLFLQDCGAGCASPNAVPPHDPYYSCNGSTASSCTQVLMPVPQQLQNPVGLFATDNNGVLIQLPALGAGGAATATGSLIFGVNTQSNNMLGSAPVFLANPVDGSIRTTTSYGNMSEPFSFIDSGSNGFFFNDSSLSMCTGTPANGFYCQSPTVMLNATMMGYNSTTPSFNYGFSISDESKLTGTASNSLGGPFGSCSNTTNNPACTFDWGLSFFYGRSVFTAVERQTINGNPGPFFAASTP